MSHHVCARRRAGFVTTALRGFKFSLGCLVFAIPALLFPPAALALLIMAAVAPAYFVLFRRSDLSVSCSHCRRRTYVPRTASSFKCSRCRRRSAI